MLGVLLESTAQAQRRGGGMALSVVTHVALIGLATAATVHSEPAKTKKIEVVTLRLDKPPEIKPVEVKRSDAPVIMKLTSTPTIPVINVVAPTVVPPTLPPINAGGTPTPDDFVVTRGGNGGHTGPISLIDDGPSTGGNEWVGNEVMMHILTAAKPRYPESLRQAGIDGSVLVQFTVDTLGRVEGSSVKILKSTHDLFSDAVRNSLGNMRFKPAEMNGKRVPALAQMPFEFQLHR